MKTDKDQEQIELEQLIALIEGSVDELKEFIRENEPGDESLERILRAEKSAKNRKTAVKYLKNELNHEETHKNIKETKICKLKAIGYEDGHKSFVIDIEGIKFDLNELPLVNLAGHHFELSHPEDDEDFLRGLSYTRQATPVQSRTEQRPAFGQTEGTQVNRNQGSSNSFDQKSVSGARTVEAKDSQNQTSSENIGGRKENKGQIQDSQADHQEKQDLKQAGIAENKDKQKESKERPDSEKIDEKKDSSDEAEKEALLESIKQEERKKAKELREELKENYDIDQDLD